MTDRQLEELAELTRRACTLVAQLRAVADGVSTTQIHALGFELSALEAAGTTLADRLQLQIAGTWATRPRTPKPEPRPPKPDTTTATPRQKSGLPLSTEIDHGIPIERIEPARASDPPALSGRWANRMDGRRKA